MTDRKVCGAKTRAGTPCTMNSGARTNHPGLKQCWLHGGRTPNIEKAAAREKAAQQLAKLGVPRGNGDPFALLAAAVQHAQGHLEAAAQLVVEADTPAPDGTVAKRKLELVAAIEVYEQAIRSAGRVGKAAVDADVADRLAALDERAAGLLMRFVTELLERVVPAAQRPATEAWAATRLGELAAEYDAGRTVVH